MAIKETVLNLDKYDLNSMYAAYHLCSSTIGQKLFPPILIQVHLRDNFNIPIIDDAVLKASIFSVMELSGEDVHMWYRLEKVNWRKDGSMEPHIERYDLPYIKVLGVAHTIHTFKEQIIKPNDYTSIYLTHDDVEEAIKGINFKIAFKEED